MTKLFIVPLFVLILTLTGVKTFASPQLPDYIIFKGDTLATYNLLIEQYFQLQAKPDEGKLFGLSFRDGSSFNCWRGYQAIYKIDNDSLFVVDIIQCGERRNGKIDKAASVEKMKEIFKDKFLKDRVYINWFSGDMKFPLNNKVLRWDGVFYTIYEKEKVISISNGKVLVTEDVENYVDDPKRIDRNDKKKISDILYKKIKKAKWKNADSCDCSDKYFVTIDEAGNVSNARMLYKPEEIEEYYDNDEYNFCVSTILNSLKKLHFDIIKDKGKPISEDIYIEIFFTVKGKIENWTH